MLLVPCDMCGLGLQLTRSAISTLFRKIATYTCIQSRDHTWTFPVRTVQFAAEALACLYCESIGRIEMVSLIEMELVLVFTSSLSAHHCHSFTAQLQSLTLYTLFGNTISRNMQFAIFFSSLIAATIALPIPQAGVSYLLH